MLTQDLDALVIRLTNTDLSLDDSPTGSRVHVTAGAGMNWHALVLATLDQGLAGLENLSLIPGSVGAAPVQNIGAYGVELADRLVSVRAWHRPSRAFVDVPVTECGFGYRDSRFKREAGDWIIVSVTLALAPDLPLNLTYRALKDDLRAAVDRTTASGPFARESAGAVAGTAETAGPKGAVLDARRVSEAVVRIRQSKLPDPVLIGNAGSFFHNPIVSAERADRLKRAWPGLVAYDLEDGRCKLAAGWLIDRLGFRGIRRGPVGVHADQALVLVHLGGGTGAQLMALVDEIRSAVRRSFDVELTIEPLVV